MKKNYAKKRFSQNFLNDKKILSKIANIIDIKNKKIIEIGPGKGALTDFLIEKAKKVVSFEIDRNLFNDLREKYCDIKNIEIINDDFLKVDLSNFKDFNIISNIPYNISTDIIFKIFNYFENFENVILLVQKEFAQRICAKPNTSEYSKLSPSTQLFYEAKYCFDVLPSAFWPKPKVMSSVIHLKRTKIKYDFNYNDLLAFIKQCFSMRRKTLWNNIKSLNQLNREKFENICNKYQLNLLVRPEELDLGLIINIFEEINKQK